MNLYTHLTIDEREQLFLLHYQGHSIRIIAEVLKRSPSTISRELARNTERKAIHRRLRNPSIRRENQIVDENYC